MSTAEEDRVMTQHAAPRRHTRTVIVLAIVLAAVAAAIAAGVTVLWAPKLAPQPDAIHVLGQMSVPYSTTGMTDLPVAGEECTADDGYDDISQGTQVVIKDNDDRTVGLGELGSGTLRPFKGDKTGLLFSCTFLFAVTVHPDGSDYYSIAVGHRGSLQYTAHRLEQPLTLTLD